MKTPTKWHDLDPELPWLLPVPEDDRPDPDPPRLPSAAGDFCVPQFCSRSDNYS